MQLPASPIKTIYYYITFACNLRCAHCYLGNHLHLDSHAEIDLVLRNLASGYEQGARELVILGGEPTLHPKYGDVLSAAAKMGYTRIVVDTNGSAISTLLPDPDAARSLTVRVSFEGIEAATHDKIRGKGAFAKAIHCLRSIQAAGYRSEVTFTINALNYFNIKAIVDFFASEKIGELNFHFVSLMGRGAENPWLGLTSEMILSAQRDLDRLQRSSSIPIRYPRLLVPQKDWQHEVAKGLTCRMDQANVVLIFPEGQIRHCPLDIPNTFIDPLVPKRKEVYQGCPLFYKLLPSGLPDGYHLTCISWK